MKIILDCDPGHDDAIALLLALASPEVELLGVTTVHGNQTLEKTTVNALKLLEFVGRTEIPVAAGADRPFQREPFVAAYVHGESGMDGPTLPPPSGSPVDQHAVDFIAETVLAAAEPVTLVPTGPLTNIGLFLARHPDAAARVERIVLMGGAIGEGNVTPAAEFNIWCDPGGGRPRLHERPRRDDDRPRRHAQGDRRPGTHRAAARRPAASARWWGSCSTSTAASTARRTAGTAPRSTTRSRSPTRSGPGSSRPFAPACDVDCDGGLGRGRTNVDLYGRMGWEANAEVAVDIDADGFVELLLERIASLG